MVPHGAEREAIYNHTARVRFNLLIRIRKNNGAGDSFQNAIGLGDVYRTQKTRGR